MPNDWGSDFGEALPSAQAAPIFVDFNDASEGLPDPSYWQGLPLRGVASTLSIVQWRDNAWGLDEKTGRCDQD